MKKKGNAVLDGITILIVVIIMAISVIFGSYAMGYLNDDIQADGDMATTTKETVGSLNSVYVSLFDNLFLFALVLFVIFVLASVFLIDTHPIFFGISLVLLLFVFVVGGLLANVYNDIATDDTISTYSQQFTYITWVMGNLLEVIIGIGFLTMIVLFAKFKAG